MAKRKKSSGQRRSGDPRKRAAEEQARAQAEASPELGDEVEAALAAEHPLDITMLASSLVASLNSDDHDPALDPSLPAELPEPAEFVRMFLDSDDLRLHVLAWTAAQLLPDARLQAEVAAALAREEVPAWLLPLATPAVVGAWQTTDPLRDSTDIVVSLQIGEADISVIGLIDFNAEAALKDGFAVPAPLTAVQEALGASQASGLETRHLSPADARAWLSGAVEAGRRAEPPFTSDSWPQARPLLQWALRQCPTGGRGFEPEEWSTAQIEQVVRDFAASAEGGVVTDAPNRAVLVDALEQLVPETYGDPRLLSAVKLEMGLGYLWATTLHHDLDALLALPDSLIPYVRWAHALRGIPADDTDAALAVIAHRRAEFVRDVSEILGPDDSA